MLFGDAVARGSAGNYVPFVLWFNFLAGFAYKIAGAGFWRVQRLGGRIGHRHRRRNADRVCSVGYPHRQRRRLGAARSKHWRQSQRQPRLAGIEHGCIVRPRLGRVGRGGATDPAAVHPGLPAQKRAALAAFDATSAHYQGVVRASLRRVADALRSLENDARVLSARAAADEGAQTSLTAVDHRYTLGVASFTQLLTAQQQAQQTRIELIADQAQRLIDSVALYQAMGGGGLVDTAVAQSPSAQTPGDVPQR